jgi:uncharacterized protein YqhQ
VFGAHGSILFLPTRRRKASLIIGPQLAGRARGGLSSWRKSEIKSTIKEEDQEQEKEPELRPALTAAVVAILFFIFVLLLIPVKLEPP